MQIWRQILRQKYFNFYLKGSDPGITMKVWRVMFMSQYMR